MLHPKSIKLEFWEGTFWNHLGRFKRNKYLGITPRNSEIYRHSNKYNVGLLRKINKII